MSTPTQPEAPTAFDTDRLRRLTHKPGVYCMLDANGDVVYVGKARDLKRRVSSYFSGRALDAKTMALVRTVADVEVTVTRTEGEALMLEYNLIKQHKPRFNVVLRDDKSYPYIHISTDQTYPKLAFYRGAKRRTGRMFGPYPSAGSVRETLNQLQKLFRIRQCEDSYFLNRTRPCLQYQIERCTAPCVGYISPEDYQRDVEHAMLFLEGESDVVTERLAERMEQAAGAQQYERAAQFRDQLQRLNQIQSKQLMSKERGDFDVVALATEGGVSCVTVMFFRGGRSLGSRNHFPRSQGADDSEIIRAFLLQYYGGRTAPPEILVSRDVPEAEGLGELLGEQAGRNVAIRWRLRGDRARFVEMALTNARHGAELQRASKATVESQLEAVAEALGMTGVPARIECVDISHTGGSETVASCVVFGVEGPMKSDYRRYNIADVEPGDDYAAIAQVIRRRFERIRAGEAPMPDLLLIDGGRGQLNEAVRVLGELGIDEPLLVGVAKGEGRRPGRETLHIAGRDAPVRLPGSSQALHLIQQLRDEAHRFAIGGHRARREKGQTASTLEEIPGVGPKKRRALLRHFGGLKAIARAGVDDLVRVHGISRDLARSIYERFHTE